MRAVSFRDEVPDLFREPLCRMVSSILCAALEQKVNTALCQALSYRWREELPGFYVPSSWLGGLDSPLKKPSPSILLGYGQGLACARSPLRYPRDKVSVPCQAGMAQQ